MKNEEKARMKNIYARRKEVGEERGGGQHLWKGRKERARRR